MKAHKRYSLILFFLIVMGIVMMGLQVCGAEEEKKEGVAAKKQPPRSVPVIPNESIITGEVLSYGILSSSLLEIKPAMSLYKLEILVKTFEDIQGKRNFTRDKVGKLISIYSKEKLSAELFGKIIKSRVSYSGDERGGMFWIGEIEALGAKAK